MEQIPCCHCGDFFTPSPRHKNQVYCMKSACRHARKAAWKRNKMQTDPDYRYGHKLTNQKWAKGHPGYWKDYRNRHPEYVKRNRILQVVRNRRRSRCHQPNADGFLSALGQKELLLYLFLVVVADRNGLSCYSYDKICALLELSLDKYLEARDGLMKKDMIAFDGTVFQVLDLPPKPFVGPTRVDQGRSQNRDTIARLIDQTTKRF